MFNIKNKVYVTHIDKFAPHEGNFILLDNGEFENLYFPEDTNFLFRYNSLSEMMLDKFENDYVKFWEYISSIDKLRIYVANEIDYATLFLYTIKELCETFGQLEKDELTKIFDIYEVSDFIQEAHNIEYNLMIDIYDDFEATGELFTSTMVVELPLEFLLFMFRNDNIQLNIANLKVVSMVEPMLTEYLSSQLLKVVGLITSNYDIIEQYLNITGIDSYIKLKKAINEDTFLHKIICDSTIDVHNDLDEIIKLYSLAYAKEVDTVEDDHIMELMIFVDLFKNPDINRFMINFEHLSGLSFFSSRYLKFNDLILKTYMV